MDETPTRGQLVLIATPLGNLGDLSSRALALLRTADVVYCEDTRHSRTLFSAHHIATGGRLRALHEHNEVALSSTVVEEVRRGLVVALISDAGTPGISDPGQRVAAAVAAAGLTVTSAPGPSAVIAALTISALASDRFVMEGFLPRRAGDRASLYDGWASEERTVVFYESPQRVSAVLEELAQRFPARRAAVVREMTKLHEEVVRASVSELAATFRGREVRGEIVVVLEGAPAAAPVAASVVRAALVEQFADGASTRDAVDYVADALGASRRVVYEVALEVRRSAPG